MKLQIIETKDSDGDWFKIKVDGTTVKYIGFGESRVMNREQALKRAKEMASWIWENGVDGKVIEELEAI